MLTGKSLEDANDAQTTNSPADDNGSKVGTLESLRDKLAAAAGPDRDLDAEIAFELFAEPAGENGYIWPESDPAWAFGIRFPGKDREWFRATRPRQPSLLVWRDGDPILMNHLRVPEYTASVDAALTLTPDDCGLRMNLRAARADIVRPRWHDIEVAAKTLALAVCLARIEYEFARTKERSAI